jgi:hypothetical protein
LNSLAGELPSVTTFRSSKGGLKDELANPHAGPQAYWHGAMIHHFQSNTALKPCVNRWRCHMNDKAEAG